MRRSRHWITLAKALQETAESRRYLLLGNGFSISLFPQCFSYASLFQEASDAGLFGTAPELQKAFEILGNIDFEMVMQSLKASAKLAPLYGFDGKKMAEHADLLKKVLVEAIAGRHPARPADIDEDQYKNCRAFLAEFIGEQRGNALQGKIFSLNYDLLLYWTVLHDIWDIDWAGGDLIVNPDQKLKNDDGFRAPEDDPGAEYVSWDQFSASNSQTITFLHGALHLFERGPELAKLCWERSGNNPLMDQIRAALDDDRYPIFVSEGSSAFKFGRINKSAYLSKGLRSFSGCCGTKKASLFVIGHSLSPNDDHILKRIKNGKIERLYVSIFGDPNGQANLTIKAKADQMAAARSEKYPLHVEYIDADTLHIWNH